MSSGASSVYNHSFGGSSLPAVSSASSLTVDAASENVKTLMRKRQVTWSYLREAYSGDAFWCQTVLLSKEDLLEAFDHHKMRSRTTRFAVLGMSLSPLLDVNVAQDFLRGLSSLVQEFDSVQDDRFERRNQRSLFRGSTIKKRGIVGGADFSLGLQDSGDASYLLTPNIPFELDYFQVLYTLCDVLAQTYHKLQSFLGSSGPLPGSTPAPSTLLPELPSKEADHISLKRSNVPLMSPVLLDMIVKLDGRLKKLISLLVKDLDGVARQAVKSQFMVFSGGKDWGTESSMVGESM